MMTQLKRHLVVNADDFAADPGVTEGIARAHDAGAVTAATALVNLDGLEHGREVAANLPELDLGLHLNLSWGPPCSQAPRLAPEGRFRGKWGALGALVRRRVPAAEIDEELRAQHDRFTECFGPPSHVDVHQHLHLARPLWDAVIRLASERGIPFVRRPAERSPSGLVARVMARIFAGRELPAGGPRRTDTFLGLGATGRLDGPLLTDLLGRVPEGLTELMVHPGTGAVTGHPDRLARARIAELEALTAPEFRSALERHGIRLTSFRAAARTGA